MSTKSLTKKNEFLPLTMNEFLKPWNEWFGSNGFWGKDLTIPAVNITEDKDNYKVSMAAPGLKKSDFNIDLDGSMLTISSQREENSEEKEQRFTRKEYNFSSFSRSFFLPDEVDQSKIEATYEGGVLGLILPKKEESRKQFVSKHIAVK